MFCSPKVKRNHVMSKLQHMFGIQHTTSHLHHAKAYTSQHLKVVQIFKNN